jgi:hypothetical protein
MRFAPMAPVAEAIPEMEKLYGRFDIGLDGRPTMLWEARNLKKWRSPEMFQLAFFPDVYVTKTLVNRRIFGPLPLVYEEIMARWTTEARQAYGLNQFVKCYNFGDGNAPSLFWYGAAWRLSPQVGGEVLGEVIKIFTRHGFTYCGTTDKRRIRDFEYW